VVDTVGVDDETRSRRRLPRRWLAVAVIVLPIAASERWGGPFTVDRVRGAVSSVAEAASDQFGLDNANQSAPSDDSSVSPVIHLTFDDGPHAVFTPQVLDVLADQDATAVFFPIGNQVAGGAATLQRAVSEGHRIGNHTWAHNRLAGATADQFERVVGRTQVAVADATGTLPTCLRPPGGKVDGRTTELAANAGLRVTMWTVDPQDWDDPDASTIVDRVLARAGDGDIVLLHDGGGDQSQTVAALDRILDELANRGFRFTAVPGC
jgi:peptidoglycan/xylan/chitin deacetylase (PgdA/CDA1 family)